MTDFVIPVGYQIRGRQLIDEIEQATYIDLTGRYAFCPPNIVQVSDALVAGHEAEVQAVIDAHVPDPLYFPEDRARLVEQGAEDAASAIPGWAAWSEAEALAWLDDNLVALLNAVPDVDGMTATVYKNNAQMIDAQWQDAFAQLVTVNRALVRMVVAMRNQLWPRLEGSG